MKIACTSDLHGHLPEIPPCDLLLIAGDLCPATNHTVSYQRHWLRTTFNEWTESLDVPVIVTWGNHDFIGEKWLPELNCKVLNDELYEFEGLTFYGCPHTKTFFNWAFMMDPPELEAHHAKIPKADVLVMHSPPFTFGDKAPRGNNTFENTGSPALLSYIVTVQPKLVVFGHIHCDPCVRQLGNSIIANVTLVDEAYRMAYPPKVFEIT